MIVFLKWWLMVCLMLVGAGVMHKFGLWIDMFNVDASKLSLAIVAIFSAVTGQIGYLTYRKWKQLDIKESAVDFCHFAASKLTTIGMIGTVIGFLMMLGLAFQDLNVEDVASVQTAIKFMALGMSTALVTTLAGLIGGLLIEIQLVLVNLDEKT